MRNPIKINSFTAFFTLTFLLFGMFEVNGQNRGAATGGGTSTKTKAQAEEMLRNGVKYKDSDESKSQSSESVDNNLSNSFNTTSTLEDTLIYLDDKVYKDACVGVYRGWNYEGAFIASNSVDSRFRLTGMKSKEYIKMFFIDRGLNLIWTGGKEGSKKDQILRLMILDFNPQDVKVEEVNNDVSEFARYQRCGRWQIYMSAINNNRAVEYYGLGLSNEGLVGGNFLNGNIIKLRFQNEETAREVAKAIKHLIKLSTILAKEKTGTYSNPLPKNSKKMTKRLPNKK